MATWVKLLCKKMVETDQISVQFNNFVLLAQIEDVAALPNLDAIANASPRLVGMSLGTEDFSASVGMKPQPELLFGPSQQIVFACRRAGIQPFGFPASIADFADEVVLTRNIKLALDMGFVGAMCIHPKQVSILNEVMVPSEEGVATAKAILAGWRRAQESGQAVFVYAGKMVDLPVVKRAEQLVRRSRQY
jgi:citrate lyase subunit beta/citryl-CoA lyase